jgi:peptidoglycan hydrolase-like protein with peptidoglycan-binding domain
MLKRVFWTFICFGLISGCALLDMSDVKVENQDAAAPDSDAQPAIAVAPPAAPLADSPSGASSSKNVPSEYVKRIQVHLKEIGFYSGPVDGIVDAGTQSAITRFENGCATLKDVIAGGDAALAQARSKNAPAKGKRGSADTVRLVQLRLKDAGFDPGPIDGIHGAKTQRALTALSSGCMMLKDFSFAAGFKKSAGINGEPPAAMLEIPDSQLGERPGREAVKSLQTQLRDAGFDPGPIDGVVGPRTRAALQKYNALVSKVSALR